MRRRAFFCDTWAFLALSNTADPHHPVSTEVDRWLEDAGYAAVTSDYVFDEAMTGVHAAAGSVVALLFAELFQARVEAGELLLVEITAPRRQRALDLFRKIGPEEPKLSFTDCTSFAVMRELGVALAFTADRHFHRAGKGIRPLLERRAKGLVFRPP